MKRFQCLVALALISDCLLTNVSALDTLDALLPTPSLLRSRADDLNVDESARARIEQMYKAAEPKYHDLKKKLQGRTRRLHAALVDDQFDTGEIAQQMKKVLETENELKLYQVRVRVRLLSEVTAEQRQRARNFASEQLEEARWKGIVADGTLDVLLPTPFWLRSRAEELGIDAVTREQFEQTYKALEPKYHELKKGLPPLTKQFLEVVLADDLDEERIVKRFDALLECETELKLHMVRVRTSLLSKVSAEQRRSARELAKNKPDGNWRKVMSDMVERVRELGKRLSDNDEPIIEIQKRMTSIEELVSEGMVTEGARKLSQLIRDLEKQLGEVGKQEHLKQDSAAVKLPSPTFRNVAYGTHQRNVLDFWQAESDKPTPLAIYYHGGGFRVFDKGKIAKKWPATVRALLDADISVAAVNYRLIQHEPLPAAFHDSRRALQFLRTKATDWNIDDARVAAWGGSAGAQIAMYLAFHDEMADPNSNDPVERQSTRLTCVATRDGQTSRDYQWWIDHIPEYDKPHMDFHAMFGVQSREAFLEKMGDVSALSLVTKDDPPIYMNYEMRPDDPVPMPMASNPRASISFQGHHVVFGIELKKKMDSLGLPAHLDYPGSTCRYRSVEQFLIARLAYSRDLPRTPGTATK
jgi:hypothetical protein